MFTRYSQHSGEDVALYAIGASGQVFYGVQEQSYIGNAIAYAGCMGQFRWDKDCAGKNSASNLRESYGGLLLVSLLTRGLLMSRH